MVAVAGYTPLLSTYNAADCDGVVRISTGSTYGTGVLLGDGHAILTSAHLLVSTPTNISNLSIVFEINRTSTKLRANSFFLHPFFEPLNDNYDLAIIRLTETALQEADRSYLYRENDEINQNATLVGYGTSVDNGTSL